jgi:ATP-dependent exoDNAse (exonuclease V) beta subunit
MLYPRVTEILRSYTNIQFIPKDTLAKAAERGSTVHALCAAIAKGEWIPESLIDESLRGYVSSFNQWMELQVSSFEIIEKRFNDEELKFTGQIDMVIKSKTDGKLYLVDLKTGAQPQKTYPVQMAAYMILLGQTKLKIEAAMLIYLNKFGEFPNIEFFENLTEERSVFLSALECWHFFHKRKKDGRNKDVEYSSKNIRSDEGV